MHLLRIMTIKILQLGIIEDCWPLREYVYFIKWTSKIASPKYPSLDLSDLTEMLFANN